MGRSSLRCCPLILSKPCDYNGCMSVRGFQELCKESLWVIL